MIYSIILLLTTSVIASLFQNKCLYVDNRDLLLCGWQPSLKSARFDFFILLVLLSLYAGLRTRFNDTSSYIEDYIYNVNTGFLALKDVKFGEGVGFRIYKIIIKSLFGNNMFRYLTITSAITCWSVLAFLKKYSKDFALGAFLFVASTYYDFTMAAMRQNLAMAIGIWAIPLFLKKKTTKGILIILIAMSFHRMIILYAVAVALGTKVFGKTSLLLIVCAGVGAFAFDSVFETIAENTGYSVVEFAEGQGVNLLRAVVWAIPLLLALLHRNELDEKCDDYGKVFINLSFVGSFIMFLATLGGANLIGRTAYYFYPFYILSLCEIINESGNSLQQRNLRTLCFIGFTFFYIITSSSPLFVDPLKHTSILSLF